MPGIMCLILGMVIRIMYLMLGILIMHLIIRIICLILARITTGTFFFIIIQDNLLKIDPSKNNKNQIMIGNTTQPFMAP